MLKSIEEVYFIIDEIVQHGICEKSKKGRKSKLTMSELITILVEGHKNGYTTEKQLYNLATGVLRPCFKEIPSYAQFTRAVRTALPYLDLILAVFCKINAGHSQEFCIVDSTSLPVSGYNKNEAKWALSSAGKGKNMHGFYQGFKLHIIINQNREIISIATTKANVHDIQALKSDEFIKHVKGILIGDKGYIASESHKKMLQKRDITLIAKQRENMDPYLNEYYKPLLQKRRIIENIFGYLKTRASLLFSFSRSHESFLAHVKTAVLVYMMRAIGPEVLYV
jgi:hypothetical protein